MKAPDPEETLARLQAYLRPGTRASAPEDWQPPEFGSYEELKAWLKEAVLTARVFEAFPDGRWTIELLLKEQEPGACRYIRL